MTFMHIGERGGHTGLQWYLGGGMTNMSTDNIVFTIHARDMHVGYCKEPDNDVVAGGASAACAVRQAFSDTA